MVKYTSRVRNGLKPSKNNITKEMATKVLQKKSLSKALPLVKAAVQKIAPLLKARFGAVLPVGGVLPNSKEILDDSTIDQLSPHVFIHMLNSMDNPTYQMLQGVAANYLNTEHPLRKIVGHALGGDFSFPKNLSKIAMRDVLKAKTPQELSMAMHSEWLDMMSGNLSSEEEGGGLFSSVKSLVKKGIAGGKKALAAIAAGAKGAVRALSKGSMGAQMVGKSLNNALLQGIEIANSLQPIIGEVFPASEGVLKSGLGKANAASQLLNRGINLSSQVEKALAPSIAQLGDLNEPIVVPFEQAAATVQPPVGAGLDSISADTDGSDLSGERFVS